MQTALGQVVLKRFLLLLLLLDKAVELPALPKGVPLLFCVDRDIKSSREVWSLQHTLPACPWWLLVQWMLLSCFKEGLHGTAVIVRCPVLLLLLLVCACRVWYRAS